MSGPVNSTTAAPTAMDYTLAAAVAIASQDAPPAPARPMQGDRSQVPSSGSASATMPLDNGEVVYQDQNGVQYTQAQLDEANRAARSERRISNAIGGGTTIAMGVATGVSAVRAVNTARTAAQVATATNGVATAARAGSLLSRVGSKVLPGVGIAFGVVSIGAGIANWNSEGNNGHWDDGLRMAGDALTIAGSAVTLSGVGAPVGLGLAAAGLIISGIGMLIDDQ